MVCSFSFFQDMGGGGSYYIRRGGHFPRPTTFSTYFRDGTTGVFPAVNPPAIQAVQCVQVCLFYYLCSPRQVLAAIALGRPACEPWTAEYDADQHGARGHAR